MKLTRKIPLYILLTTLFSCNITKYVPENEKLLNKVTVKSDVPEVTPDYLHAYIQQTPNNFFLSLARVQLGMYSLSGKDTTKWINRWLRKVGEPPVVFSEELTLNSQKELLKELQNKGYMNAQVIVTEKDKKRKVNVTYEIKGNDPYLIRSFDISLPDDTAMKIINRRRADVIPKIGSTLDIDVLDAERERVAKLLRYAGYYQFGKDLLHFVADSTHNDKSVDVELNLRPEYLENDSTIRKIFTRKRVNNVTIYDISQDANRLSTDIGNDLDTVYIQNYCVIHDKDKPFSPKMLISKTFISPNKIFSERDVERTYAAMNSMTAVKHINVSFKEHDANSIDCYIIVTPNKPHNISFEIEGTNSDGNLGVGVGLGYENRNMFKGSEIFKVGANGSYEAMGKIGQIYNSVELGGNMSLKFPSFLVPFTSTDFKRRIGGSTEVSASVNFQKRPQYQRNIANATYKYAWKYRRTNFTFNLVDISYIYIPWMDDAFRDEYLGPSSSIRYSYEDHFIMRWGMSFFTTNQRQQQPLANYYTLRGTVSTAGNLLYGLSALFNQQKENDSYKIFNIRYSQYVKGDIDYSYNIIFNKRNRLVCHAALGVALPYGNASILPFEERYFSGGANSVRGWAVRALGPGGFQNTNGYLDYMIQSGDIKLDLNLEARFKLFWKINGAAFIDAGNIWTIKNYTDQPNGQFKFDEFYKQIGCSYGVGLRADFDFFVIRVDMGVKLYDPAYSNPEDRWRTTLSWNKDVAFHFAVGYPF